MTNQPKPARMTADEFLAWAEAQPSGRYELIGSVVVQMPGERVAHNRAKAAAAEALHAATASVGARCEAMIGGMAVRIDERTMYVPDALVRCGQPLPGDAIEVLDPVVVVEVVSPAASDSVRQKKL